MVRNNQRLPGILFAAVLLGLIVFSEANVRICPPPLVLFDDYLGNGITLQGNTNRASCQIVSDNSAPQGSKVLLFSTSSWLANGDNCALNFPHDYDISAYTEIEFWLRSNHDGQYVTPSMKTSNSIRGFGLPVVGTQWKHYRFPLPQSFNGLDLHHVVSAFLLQLQLNAGDEIRVDYIRLLCRDYFPIFSDETEPGREQVEPGSDQCQVLTDSSNHGYLRMTPNAWSCYLFFRDPSLNLNNFKAIQFWLKSYQDVLITIQSNQHFSVQVTSTGGKWKQVTIPLSAFGNVDLSNVIAPFSIQRAQSNTGLQREILVSDVRYLQWCDDNSLYCNDFEQRVGNEWSYSLISTTPADDRHFLGAFITENVTFSLRNLPSHQYLKVEFDLFIIKTWDGISSVYGPDVWSLVVDNGPVLLRTTFSNEKVPVDQTFYQNYPDWYPGAIHPGTTGATERGTLGYPDEAGYDGYGDSVYRLSFVFPHSSPNLKLYFGSEPRLDLNELWGIDNFCVSKVVVEA